MPKPARQHLIAIHQALFHTTPEWSQGPLPLAHADIRADTAGRSSYYPPRTARLLYGTSSTPRRWHKNLHQRIGDTTVHGIEALRLTDQPLAEGLVIVHLQVRGRHFHDIVRALGGRPGTDLPGYQPARLVQECAQLSSVPPYTVAFTTPRGFRLPRLFRKPRYLSWPARDQWLWGLASRTNDADHPPAPNDLDLTAREQLWLSADWCALVLRQGTALVGTRPDKGTTDPFYNHAALYTHTLYLDAVLIGLLQLHGITDLEETLAAAIDTDTHAAMEQLERQVTRFRHELWWQHLTTRGIPNQILAALHQQHRLKERFDQILTEINDYNQLTRDDENRSVNNAVVLFTLITVPPGIALALLQALGSKDPLLFGAVLIACLITTGLLLLTRPARTAMRSIRRRFSS